MVVSNGVVDSTFFSALNCNMSKSFHNVRSDRECTNKCKLEEHASTAIAAITKRGIDDRQLASYLSSLCSNVGKTCDEFGRTALHMATACGRYKLALWLISVAKSDINARDTESGYTALHKSIFYGYINIAVKLIKLGANIDLKDYECMTPLNIADLDRPPQMISKISKYSPCQLYVWGSNNNYTIGTGTANERKHPKLMNTFGKNTISIKQVAMEEFHSVFVSQCGRVWTCGLGPGGRLGTGSEKNAVIPTPIKLPSEFCLEAAVALNHTLLLFDSGIVMAFGLNSHYQLGVVPYVKSCLHPRIVCMEHFKQKIEGICAAKYHSVFYTKTSLYTCGVNGGQLGLPCINNATTITIPTQVRLNLKEDTIKCVVCSTGAIIVLTNNGFIFCTHQYQHRKIMKTRRLRKVVKVCVVGGIINTEVIPDAAVEELKIFVLTSEGEVLTWNQDLQIMVRCVFRMEVSDICLTYSHLLFTTTLGEAYEGVLKDRLRVTNIRDKLWDWQKCYQCKIGTKRLQGVHRAVSITADPKGNNFSVIQVHPKASCTQKPRMSNSEIPGQLKSLLEEASVDDFLHDVVFSVNNELFPAHRYILALSNSGLSEIARAGGTVVIEDVKPYIFKQLLLFIYTGQNEIIHLDPLPNSAAGYNDDPVKQMHEAACKFKVQPLIRKLSALRYFNGLVILKYGNSGKCFDYKPEMNRDLFPELYDVKLESTDGIVFEAHKCVLAARLEYFQSMLNGGWVESGSSKILKLQFHSSVLKDVIDFLYTEKVPDSLSADDIEHTVSLVIAADQLFINNLRNACECVLCELLTLTNIATILQMSLAYNMDQLKMFTMEFMHLNLTAVLESRVLDSFDDKILDEFNSYVRSCKMQKYSTRIITPFSYAPSDETIQEAPEVLWPDDLEEIIHEPDNVEGKKSKHVHNSSKKRNHKKSIGDTPAEELDEEICVTESVDWLESKPEPPDELWSDSQFPSLDCNVKHTPKTSTPKLSPTSKKPLFPKLSQKQRKKIGNSPEVKIESVATSKFKGWAKIPDLPTASMNNLGDHLTETSAEANQFVDIVASMKEERNNWMKMKRKLFTLTQIEDKAIEDLLDFYNANNMVDERITIQRVLPTNVAKPTWIKSNRQH